MICTTNCHLINKDIKIPGPFLEKFCSFLFNFTLALPSSLFTCSLAWKFWCVAAADHLMVSILLHITGGCPCHHPRGNTLPRDRYIFDELTRHHAFHCLSPHSWVGKEYTYVCECICVCKTDSYKLTADWILEPIQQQEHGESSAQVVHTNIVEGQMKFKLFTPN